MFPDWKSVETRRRVLNQKIFYPLPLALVCELMTVANLIRSVQLDDGCAVSGKDVEGEVLR